MDVAQNVVDLPENGQQLPPCQNTLLRFVKRFGFVSFFFFFLSREKAAVPSTEGPMGADMKEYTGRAFLGECSNKSGVGRASATEAVHQGRFL